MLPFKPLESFYGQQRAFRFEADVHDCEVVGEIPAELNGSLYRVGPDTLYPTRDGDVIINGDGMVSAFTFADGHVDFRCRYVKTERYLRERAARKRLYGAYRNAYTDDASVADTDRDNTANTTGFFHHGRLFALREDSHPTELDPVTLETLGTFDFDGALAGQTLTAHPKIDPVTGEWWAFSFFSHKLYDGEMTLCVADRDGKLIRQEEFKAPFPGVAHDFAVTREHVIFPVMPLTVDLDRLAAGGDFYAYDPSLNPVYGIMPRDGTVADLRWFEVPRGFMAHTMNAYSEGSVIHLDATVAEGNSFRFFKDINGVPTDPGLGFATMTRLSFDLSSTNDHVEIRPFPGTMGEMPRCDDRYQMQRYRYGFGKSRDGIMRLDWDTGELQVHPTADAPGGAQEPVFVPRSPDAPEGDGYLLCVVNRHAENRADLVIVDTMDMTGPPVATVRLPFNQPMAFHGMFVPAH